MHQHAHLELAKQPPIRLHFHVPGDRTHSPYFTEDAGVALAMMAKRLRARAGETDLHEAASPESRLADEYEDIFSNTRSRAEHVLYSGVSIQVPPSPRDRETYAEVLACRFLDCMRYCPDKHCARTVPVTSDEYRCPECERRLVAWDVCDWIDYTSFDAWNATYDCVCSLAYDDWDFLPSLQHTQIIVRAWVVREEMPILGRWADMPIGAPCEDLEAALTEAEQLRQRLAADAESWPHEGEPAPQIAAVAAACRCLRSHLGDTLAETLINQARRDHHALGRQISTELISATFAVVAAVVGATLAALTGDAGDLGLDALEVGCLVYVVAVLADIRVAYDRRLGAQTTIREFDRPRRQLGAPITGSAT
ncbi:MAG: hypothetical protein J2P17_00900 [Mycobacterium sp.]|nr:hypothetical protein [Mycobacterium sp.]